MDEVVLKVVRLDLQGAIEICRELWALPAAQRYVIDFAPLEWLEPFGMLLFARQLRTFADRRKPARFRAINHEGHGYAAHMGFFQSFGLNFGNHPGEAAGSMQYVPITGMPVAELEAEAGQRSVDEREVIESRCWRLAAVLARADDSPLQNTLSFSLREIFRNVLEHSRADTIWYAAQYWPAKQMVELSILDQGIGVRSSLARNPHLKIEGDEDAIRLSLLPGISGVAFKGGPRMRRDAWANSGYGLFMTSQLCARGGSFTICSGQHGLLLENGTETTFDVGLEGTALRLKIYVPEVRGLNETLENLRKRGALIAGELRQTANLTASMSSRMLSKDFSS